MNFLEISQEEFTDFALSMTASFLQTGAMSDLLRQRGYQTYFLAVKSDKIELAALLTSTKILGGLKFELNFGPIGDDNEEKLLFFLTQLKNFVKGHGGIELKIRPNIDYLTFDKQGVEISKPADSTIDAISSCGFIYDGRHVGFDAQEAVAEWQYLKDLSELTDEVSLLATYNSNAKRNVKKAIKNGLTVEKAAYEQLDLIEQLIEHTGEKQHFATKDLAYYQDFYRAFGDKTEMLLTLKDGLPTAAGVFVEVNQTFLYLFGGSDTAYARTGGPFLLQHTAMLHALSRGLKYYNFYGISGKFDGSDGVLKFKQNFGGFITQKIGEFSYYPHPAKLRLIHLAKKTLRRN